MLLPSQRHTPQDRECWRGLEAADKLHGQHVESKVEKAITLIREFAESPCYVAVSWGKDSVVIAHLLWRSGLRLPVVHIVQDGPQYDPEIPRVRDAFIEQFPLDYHEIRVEPQAKEQAETKHAPAMDIGIQRTAKQLGTARYIGGVRADESSARRVGFRHRGLTCNLSCQPIGWWTTEDVFGYVAANDVPLHPAYGMLGGGRWDRNRIRISIIGGKKGTQFGRRDWEAEYYGDVLRRIQVAKQKTPA